MFKARWQPTRHVRPWCQPSHCVKPDLVLTPEIQKPDPHEALCQLLHHYCMISATTPDGAWCQPHTTCYGIMSATTPHIIAWCQPMHITYWYQPPHHVLHVSPLIIHCMTSATASCILCQPPHHVLDNVTHHILYCMMSATTTYDAWWQSPHHILHDVSHHTM